jgi:hypothetical protein
MKLTAAALALLAAAAEPGRDETGVDAFLAAKRAEAEGGAGR